MSLLHSALVTAIEARWVLGLVLGCAVVLFGAGWATCLAIGAMT